MELTITENTEQFIGHVEVLRRLGKVRFVMPTMKG